MNEKEFIKTISTIPYRPLTKELKWAVENKKILTPYLLDVLKKSIKNIKKISREDSGHIFSAYLLAQFRVKAAFPLIITLLKKMKGGLDERVFGEELEHMPNILASTFNGKIKLLYDLIEDKNAYEFCRAAALETLVALCHTKQLNRKSVITYFKKLLVAPIKTISGEDMRWWVIYEAVKLYPIELIQDIRLAFYFMGQYADYDDNTIVEPKEFEESMKKGRAYVLKKYLHSQKYHFITDVKFELHDWNWFEPEHDYMKKKEIVLPEPKKEEPEAALSNDESKDDGEYYFLCDATHLAQCHQLFGKFNDKGLLSLHDNYDTDQLERVSEYFDNLSHHVDDLRQRMELMASAARKMIDGDAPWQNNYDVKEHGDIGDFAYTLHELVSDREFDLPDKIVKKIAPLCRLMPVDDIGFDEPCEFYKDIDDTLDEAD